jgi:hypothetical protein
LATAIWVLANKRMALTSDREGRFLAAAPKELNVWLGEESGKPVHVALEITDLTAELKRGPSYVRNEKRPKTAKQRVGKRTS